ncbi:type VI secretion system baseplate subunit TssF [Corticibacter populi]|uniref:Type VI secretion system baseplate subunit TssF n=1 Tax=Corticibacter populi TaxID=1550736 RepID=A0A3M6QMD9_9BURK|nr:type VI secretion system baseplate subunit TssF [Corticibacter populi]RMX04248.1 type VI secretion system baseplate subunit TssF [Corticibacter populi]RZS33290.1 type VI secretion system protein ImpG [Corticibacter populi]
MLDELLPYYEEELSALRQQSRAFAAQYPKIAAQLMLDGEACEDPHVERMIESFAFLAARVHKKLNDDFPQISAALLEVLYPHFLRPVPSMSIVQLLPAAGVDLSGVQTVARGTMLLTRPIKGMPVRFRTAWPVEVAPMEVTQARCEALERGGFGPATPGNAFATVRIQLSASPGQSLAKLGLTRLRFHLDGESAIVHALHEILLSSVDHISIAGAEDAAAPLRLDASHLRGVGLDEGEGLLEYGARSFGGYRLLQEYFALPEKFLFIELDGLDLSRFERRIEIRLHLRPFGRAERLARLETAVQASTFRLHCTPVVNLFTQQAEPVRISQQVHEYPVIPDVRRPLGLEVYSIDAVRRHRRGEGSEQVGTYAPLYAIAAPGDPARDEDSVCWMARRSASQQGGDAGTDVHIALVDRALEPRLPVADTLSIALTCTNRDLPAHLPFGGEDSFLQLEEAGAIASARLLRKPTAPSRAALRHASQWKLISHLALNRLSLVDGGREALQGILGLYDFSGSASLRKQIAGIVDVRSEVATLQVGRAPRQAFVRGTEITLTFDEDQYVGSGIHVLAQVLDVFFGLYCAANSWTRLTVLSRQREMPVAVFAPRSGAQPLV